MMLQVIRHLILKNSIDKENQNIHASRFEKERKLQRVWKGCIFAQKVESAVQHQIDFPSRQNHRLGLGWGHYEHKLSWKEKKEKVSSAVRML